MALDPNIALSVRVAPFETRIQSPVDRYARMLSLRQLMQQQQTSEALEEQRRYVVEQARKKAARVEEFQALDEPTRKQRAYELLDPTAASSYLEKQQAAVTTQQAQEQARIKNEKARDAMLGQIAGGVLNANTQEGFERGIFDAGARDLISQDELHQLIGLRWDDPQTKAQVAQIARRGSEIEKQQAMDIARAGETRAAAIAKPTLAKAETEAVTAQAQLDAGLLAAAASRGPEALQAALATLPPERAQLFQGATTPLEIYKRGQTPAQRVTSEQATATATATERHQKVMEERAAAAAAETARHNRAIEARISQATVGGLTSPQRQAVLQIGGQFDNEPMVRNYNVIAESGNFVQNLGEGFGGNAGDDQALLYAFAKAMDPGSVVREGEYATVQKYSQSWADTFGFKAARIFSNSPFLSDDARQKMKATIQKKVSSAKTSYDNIHSEYARRIEETAGVENGKRFITNYGQAFGGEAAGKKAGGAEPGAPAVGTVKGGYEFTGGDPADKKNWKKTT